MLAHTELKKILKKTVIGLKPWIKLMKENKSQIKKEKNSIKKLLSSDFKVRKTK